MVKRAGVSPQSQLGAPAERAAPPKLLNHHGPPLCLWGAPSPGTYSLRNCCASSLLRNTLGPWVSAATRLTSRRQSPGPSASTLHGDSGNRAQRGQTPRETQPGSTNRAPCRGWSHLVKVQGKGSPPGPLFLTSRPRLPSPCWPRSGCRCRICCRSRRLGSGQRCPARNPASCARCPPPPSHPRPAPAGGSLQGRQRQTGG